MTKKAVLIISPGGNGNHMWTKIMIGIGSVPIGDDDFGNVVIDWPPTAPVVHWFRSMPSQRYPMTEIGKMILSLRDIGYDVMAIVPTRDWFCMDQSQRKRHREAKSIYHARTGYPYILQIYNEMGVPFVFGSYEAAVKRKEYIEWVLGQFELGGSIAEIYDGNKKWYGEKS
jgi:hypothetical protein